MFENIFSKSEKQLKKENKEKPKIIADIHEKNSLIISELVQLGANVEKRKLEVGDYVVNDVIIERKTLQDFLSSMLNKRLQYQLRNMQNNKKSLLIIENFESEPELNINPNCIKGFIMSILLEYKIPIIFTKDSKETADYLYLLAKKSKSSCQSLRIKIKNLNKKEKIQYILEGFPSIGPITAKKLLKKFGSLKNIINANEKDLEEILGKKTKEFISLLNDY
ncbi:MAG: ERCC4 domain-containing protein [Candidatus Pacearchaeota archaeon]